MSNRNIHQVTDFSQLKKIVSENLTVIIGMVCPTTPIESKVMIKKFLKRKSELYPLIHFVFIDLTEKQIQTTRLEIVSDDYDDYPLIYHIRDGNKVLCRVESADPETTYESFDEVAPYYRKEMEEFSKSQSKSTNQKRPKKAKVILNISNSDSESEIEIDRTQNLSLDKESNGSNKLNPDTANNVNGKEELDPQTKAAIEREKFYALEKEFTNMQKKFFEEAKYRIKIEKEAEAEEEAAKKKNKKDKKSNVKDEQKEVMRQPEKPQKDQIGPSSKSNKTRQNVRRRR